MPRLLPPVVLSLLLGPLALLTAVDQASARQHLQTIVAKRDQALAALNERLAADRERGDFVDFKLRAEELYRHVPLTFELYARGETVYGGIGYLKSFNQGTHAIDASELRFVDGVLSGSMRVTLKPDQWVPADHQPRFQEHEIHAVVDDGAVAGWYRFTGHLGPDKDRLLGSAQPVGATVTVDAPTGQESVAEGLAGLAELAAHATTAYRQLRAASLALRDYPVSYERCLERNRVRDPSWDLDQAGAAEQIASYVAAVAEQASGWRLEDVATTDFAVGFVHPEDEHFGPFFAKTALPVDEGGIARLPAETGEPGPQRWQYVDAWQVIGPFPAPHRTSHIDPQLPELVRAPGARYQLPTDVMIDSWIHLEWLPPGKRGIVQNSYQAGDWLASYERPDSATLREVTCTTAGSRYEDSVLPPIWQSMPVKLPVYGLAQSFFYASTRLHSDRAQQVWAESKVLDAGELWVNGRLAWHSVPDIGGFKKPKFAVFPVQLREGVNDLVYRCRNDDPQSRFRVLFCTRGVPADSETLAARREQGVGEAHFDSRGDGSGTFAHEPGVKPPVAWDIDSETGVRWSLPMPSYSNASPVIVGDRVFTNCEPHWLYCVDRRSGEVLWKRASSYAEFIDGPERGAVEAALERLGNTFAEVRDPELVALLDERREVERGLAEGDQLDEARRTELETRSAELAEAIDRRSSSKDRGLRLLKKHGIGATGWHDWTGYTMPTPVTDGGHIWVKYTSGVVACYDLTGERRWMVDTKLNGDIPGCSSPCLVDGVLVVEGGTRKRAKAAGLDKEALAARAGAEGKEDLHWIVGLDASTGEELWDRPIACLPNGYGTPGGPRPMALKWQGEQQGVIVTQFLALRASDGSILNAATGNRPSHTGYVLGDTLVGEGLTKFWWEGPDQLGIRHLLNGVNGDAVLVDGAFYSAPDAGKKIANTHVPWINYQVVDADTGVVVHQVKPLAEEAGTPNHYVPAAACGDYIYLTDGRCGSLDKPGVRARIIVAKAGEPYEILARNEVDSVTYSAPVFAADGLMYLRTRRSLTCFERTPACAPLELERSVTELFYVKSKLPAVPSFKPITNIDPVADFEPAADTPVVKLYERLGPERWLHAGPFKPAEGVDHLEPLGGPAAARPTAGTAVGDQAFAPLDMKHVDYQRGLMETIASKKAFQYKSTIMLTGISPRGGAANYFYTVVEVTRPKAVTFYNKGKGYRQWLAGVEIEHGKDYRLTPGYYPLMVESRLGKLPPIGSIKIGMSVQFIEQPDPIAELRRWQAAVRPLEHRLQAALDGPNGKWAFEAERYLKKLEE